jgi:hypothetical protein
MNIGGKSYNEAGGCKTHAQKPPEFFSRGHLLFQGEVTYNPLKINFTDCPTAFLK